VRPSCFALQGPSLFTGSANNSITICKNSKCTGSCWQYPLKNIKGPFPQLQNRLTHVGTAGRCYKAKFPYKSAYIRQDSNKGLKRVFCTWQVVAADPITEHLRLQICQELLRLYHNPWVTF
jgi:hypothetical protein